MTIYTSGEEPIEAGDEWATLLEVPGHSLVNYISVVNEGDLPGFWRLVSTSGTETPSVRLPCGGGDAGSRRAGFNIPCPGWSGTLQVRVGVIGGRLTGLFAWGMK